MKKVYRTQNQYVRTGKIDLKKANEVYIENTGYLPLTVLGVVLGFGDSITWTNHAGEIEDTVIELVFTGGKGLANVITKRYY